jgi:hypothetical protein
MDCFSKALSIKGKEANLDILNIGRLFRKTYSTIGERDEKVLSSRCYIKTMVFPISPSRNARLIFGELSAIVMLQAH